MTATALRTNRELQDYKRSIYPYVGIIRDDGSVHGMLPIEDYGHRTQLADDGSVYRRKRVIGRWYAEIGKSGYRAAWLVRRDKLNDVRRIEALRWRIARRLYEVALPVWEDVWERSKALGRIYHRHWSSHERQFTEWDDRGNSETYTLEEWGDRKGLTSAIDRLTAIARPEEIALGDEFDAARDYRDALSRRLEMLDEVLETALKVAGCQAPGYDGRFHENGEALYRARINGRIYILVVSERGYGFQRVWPSPSETELDFDSSSSASDAS